MIRRPPRSTLFPYTTALPIYEDDVPVAKHGFGNGRLWKDLRLPARCGDGPDDLNGSNRVSKPGGSIRSEEHTSELQSHLNLVCRLLLEKKKKKVKNKTNQTIE